jgi:hypothetical protein
MNQNNESGGPVESVVRLTKRTSNGSEVRFDLRHGGRVSVDFNWFEENGCIDCEVDLDASRASGWTMLVWGCCECTGGMAPLEDVET